MISKKRSQHRLFYSFISLRFPKKKWEGKENGGLDGHAEQFSRAKLPPKQEIARNFDARSTP